MALNRLDPWSDPSQQNGPEPPSSRNPQAHRHDYVHPGYKHTGEQNTAPAAAAASGGGGGRWFGLFGACTSSDAAGDAGDAPGGPVGGAAAGVLAGGGAEALSGLEGLDLTQVKMAQITSRCV